MLLYIRGKNKGGNSVDIVKVRDLTFEYIRRDNDGDIASINKAIDHVSLDVKKGDFICILGGNGSGKSTFAKHINAILNPTEGTVWVDGLDTNDEENLWKVRQTAGMVFQNPDNQIIATIVEEDVAFGPENLGVPTKEIIERVEESLNAVGMSDYREHSPNKLSGGQKQRIAIAGILAMKPKCIVLDEPTAMLDPSGREDVLKTIRKINIEDGITVILITHHMEETIFSDRIFVMDKGSKVMEGSPREIFSQVDHLKKYSLDLPQVTELAHELRKEGLPMPAGILTIDEFVEAIAKIEVK